MSVKGIAQYILILLGTISVAYAEISIPHAFPLRISLDGRHIEDAKGEPYLMVADVAWQLLRKTSYEDALQYFDIRKSQSFNTVLIQVIPGLPTQRNFYKITPFANGDIKIADKRYFDHLEKIIKAAEVRGLAVGLVVVGKNWNTVFETQGVDAAKSYGTYLATRFAKFKNIVWIIPDEQSTGNQEIKALSKTIKDENSGNIVASLSTCNALISPQSTDIKVDMKFVIPDSTVTVSEYAALAASQKEMAEGQAQPFLISNSEFPKTITDQSTLIRNQAYESIMSAAAGFCHQSTIKNFNPTWKVNIRQDGADYIQNFVKIMERLPWVFMKPEHDSKLLPDSTENAEIGVFKLSNGRMAMLYLPQSKPIHVNLTQLTGSEFTAVWYSPRTGKRWGGGDFPISESTLITPPDAQADWDWILLIGSKN